MSLQVDAAQMEAAEAQIMRLEREIAALREALRRVGAIATGKELTRSDCEAVNLMGGIADDALKSPPAQGGLES